MSSFHRSLNRFQRNWRLGRVCLFLLALVGVLVAGFLLHGWLDYKFAFSSEARSRYNNTLFAMIGLVGLGLLIQTFRVPRQKIATMADEKLADPRKRILAAASLEKLSAQQDLSEMQKFHLDRAMSEASGELDKLPTKRRFPLRAIGILALVLLSLGTVVWGLSHWASEPFRVVSTRILNPNSDLPPYSPLRFAVTPDDPRAVYGGEAVVQVKITGGEIEEDVICLVRNVQTGKVEQTTAYREGKTGYAKKFENALEPVEFAFATGRARSAWHRLDVLLEPKVSAAQVTITPPAYSGKPKQEFSLESGEIQALEGSTITLSLESNRPLSGGDLEIKSLDKNSDSPPEIVSGDRTEKNGVSFTWVAHRSTQLSALIRDVRSTPAAKPLELSVKTEPDQVPVVELTSPEQMVLATPNTELPFFGEVEDDLGLAKVSLVRALLGYRDRNRVLADSLVKKEYDFKEPLKLTEVGVEVGQILEFYLEAMDRNPSLLGMGVSDVVRVKIISEDEYAERIRDKVELEQFTARYRALANAIEKSRKAMEDLAKAAEAGDEKAFAEAKKNAEAANKQAQDLAERMAKDFQAFDMEKRLAEIAQEAAEKLGENQQGLAQLKMDGDAKEAIAEMQNRLGGVQKQAEQAQQDAETVKKVGRVMAMAAEFKKIYNTQKSIMERKRSIADEVAKGITTNTGQLNNLARVQDDNRKALLKMAVDLKKHADDLPEEFAQMKVDVADFLTALEYLDIPNPMETAAEMARKGKSNDAATNALLALTLMEDLMQKPNNGFCEMCQGGGGPRFQVKPDVAGTMEQMLQALMKRAGGEGKGQTGGAGGGAGGSGQDGFSVAGNSTNIPVYGPDRLNFSEPSTGKSTHSGNGTAGGRGSQAARQQPSSQVNPTNLRNPENAKLLPENVPEKYRQAVKRYFSQEEPETSEPTL